MVPSIAKLMLIGNQPLVARCKDVIVDASSSCTASISASSVNNGGSEFDTCFVPPGNDVVQACEQ